LSQRAFRGRFKMTLAQREDNRMSTNTPNEKGTPQSRTYTVNDIAAILGIGRATAYKLANSGEFKTIRIGNMIRISRKSFEDWLKAEGLDDETE
jgi:excisionase family DNA binding protein